MWPPGGTRTGEHENNGHVPPGSHDWGCPLHIQWHNKHHRIAGGAMLLRPDLRRGGEPLPASFRALPRIRSRLFDVSTGTPESPTTPPAGSKPARDVNRRSSNPVRRLCLCYNISARFEEGCPGVSPGSFRHSFWSERLSRR